MCISPSFLTATAIPSHISHPFLCVPLEPPSWWSCLTFKGPFQHKLPLCVHGLPSLHPSAPNASSPPSSSLCLAHSGNPLQLIPFPPELLPAGICQLVQRFYIPDSSMLHGLSIPETGKVPGAGFGAGSREELGLISTGCCKSPMNFAEWKASTMKVLPNTLGITAFLIETEKGGVWLHFPPPSNSKAQPWLLTQAVTPVFKWQVKAPGFSSQGLLRSSTVLDFDPCELCKWSC